MAGRPFLNVCIQRHKMDCAVATLSMLLGHSYEEVLLAFRHNVIKQGASIRQVQMAARRLKSRLRWSRRAVDLEHDTGIIIVSGSKWKTDHLVLLKEGLIIDTDATIWEPDVFLSAYNVTVSSILTLEE